MESSLGLEGSCLDICNYKRQGGYPASYFRFPMFSGMFEQLLLTLRWALRDRILHAVMGVGLLLLLLIPVFSRFSMRQVQESALTLILSVSSFVLVLLAIQLGSSAVYRDIERRYAVSTLALPLPRGSFILGRFVGISLFLVITAVVFVSLASILIPFAASINPPDRPAIWSTVFVAFGFNVCMAILLVAVSMLLSCVSTSFALPFFCSIAIYLAGSASQQVYDFLHSSAAINQSPLVKLAGDIFYYLLPNFSAFDLHLQAIYGLPLVAEQLLTTFAYFVLYVGILLVLSIVIFERREMV